MVSYNFTYKDVLKRYERIINKPSKFEIRLLATILLIITIVNISSLCFAFEQEDVELTTIGGIVANVNSNVFTANSSNAVKYFYAEKGYKYIIRVNQTFQQSRIVVSSSEQPALNVVYDILYNNLLTEGSEFIYSPSNDTFISISTNFPDSYISVYKEPLDGQSGAVSSLVNNVGISQFWDIFDTGIGFVGVVVLVSFGIFLVVIAIRKMQKGKSEF